MSIDNNLYEKSIKILTDLIAFKTISGQDNSSLIDYCENILNNIGIDTFKVYDDDKKRVNLFGTLKAKNQSTKKPIILSGHTDVVPVSKGWSSDPFVATIKNDKLYGRGSCDMKGFIACTLAFAPIFAKTNLSPEFVLYGMLLGFLFFLSQMLCFLSLKRGDASLMTPIMGSKPVFVAVFVALLNLTPNSLTHTTWIAVGLATLSITLIGWPSAKSDFSLPGILLAVTGAAGFIGAAVCKRLLADGESVIGIDNINDYYDVSLKEARLERLKAEIATYIEDRPGCSAADIVAYLSNERKMRNHGLTARKIGYFIPRHMKNRIGFKLDATTGKRIYHVMG